jgi:hypothetical protein
MSVSAEIIESYRRPRRVFRRRLERGADEGQALACLMGACALIFLSQWPGLSRAAHLDPAVPLEARLGGALMATMFLLPLIAYGLAALSHLLARLFGGRGSYFTARLALFWAMLAVSPVMLAQGLFSALAGPGPLPALLGLGVLAAFLVLWLGALIEAEWP